MQDDQGLQLLMITMHEGSKVGLIIHYRQQRQIYAR
jgi:hypothetical protein